MSQNPNSPHGPLSQNVEDLVDVEPVDTSIGAPDSPHTSIDFAHSLSGTEVGNVLLRLNSLLGDPGNRENWRHACEAVLAEEKGFPKHGADMGYLQVVTNNFNPDQGTWRPAALAHLGRMRADGVYPGDVAPSFNLAKEAGSVSPLMELARFAFKMQRFREAMEEAPVFMARRATAEAVAASLPGQI